MGLLHGTRSNSSSSNNNNNNNNIHYRPPPRRVHLSRRSMTTARPSYQRNLNPQHPLFGPLRPSLQVTCQLQMPRSIHTRVRSAERGSRGVAICSVTYGYTQASAHSYALSQVAGRNSFRYVVQNFRIIPHVDLMCARSYRIAIRVGCTHACTYWGEAPRLRVSRM